jgi:hypothetical protein
VAAVEEILSVTAARSAGQVPLRDGRAIVDRAVWFCACVTLDEAPTWLIYETSDGSVGWRRVPDGSEITDLVDAPFITGHHVDPVEVLHWLQDQDATSVPGDAGTADRAVIQQMGRKIRELAN